MIEPGKYRAKIIGPVREDGGIGEWGYAESSGNLQIGLEFEIQENGVSTGVTVNWMASFTDNTTQRINDSLKACGWDGECVSSLAGVMDNEVEIVVEINEWNGKSYPKVAWVNRPGSGRIQFRQPIEAHEVKRLTTDLERKLKALNRPAGSKSAPKPTKPAPRKPPAEKDPYGLTDEADPF